MDYGEIIKRAWHVTWRYKALWVLGLFAGISGCQGGGSPGSSGTGARSSRDFSAQDFHLPSNAGNVIERLLPAIVAASIAFFFVAVVWGIMSIAARGGLIAGVNGVEEGRNLTLSELWRVGFSRWWSVLGLGILLNLPVALLALFIVGAAVIPLIPLASQNISSDAIGAAAIVPICGSLAIGVPLLIVAGFVLGIMYLIALRYLIMGGQGVFESAGNAWHFFRNRIKDCVLMYIISGALNLAAGLVVAIPIGIVAVAAVVPAVFSARAGEWSLLAGGIAVAVVAAIAIGLVYNAIWGTYTSALWTLFFRRVQGMYPVQATAPAWPTPGQPPAWPAPGQPPAWQAQGQPPAPPMAGEPPAPTVPFAPPPPFTPPESGPPVEPSEPPVEPTDTDG